MSRDRTRHFDLLAQSNYIDDPSVCKIGFAVVQDWACRYIPGHSARVDSSLLWICVDIFKKFFLKPNLAFAAKSPFATARAIWHDMAVFMFYRPIRCLTS